MYSVAFFVLRGMGTVSSSLRKFKPEWWNVSGLRQDLVNPTNNPLERYNRSLNEAFSVAHPNVTQYIGVIEEQSRENVRLLPDISNRRARAPNYSPAQAPSDLEPDSELDSDFEDSEILKSTTTPLPRR
ncbi:hypothetical protein GQ600_25894 [Phytophthora cactorum]|nr:hypothetical protein GQ600_25894 [Phytophthora cactorum]